MPGLTRNRDDKIWILAGVYPKLDSGFRRNDRFEARMTNSNNK